MSDSASRVCCARAFASSQVASLRSRTFAEARCAPSHATSATHSSCLQASYAESSSHFVVSTSTWPLQQESSCVSHPYTFGALTLRPGWRVTRPNAPLGSPFAWPGLLEFYEG